MLRDLLDNFCDGSARQLMMNLAEQESLGEEDLREIKRLTKATRTHRKKGKR